MEMENESEKVLGRWLEGVFGLSSLVTFKREWFLFQKSQFSLISKVRNTSEELGIYSDPSSLQAKLQMQ